MAKRTIAKKPEVVRPEIVDDYPNEVIGGVLAVSSDGSRVYLTLPEDEGNSFWFSPRQARALADMMNRHADRVDEQQSLPKLD